MASEDWRTTPVLCVTIVLLCCVSTQAQRSGIPGLNPEEAFGKPPAPEPEAAVACEPPPSDETKRVPGTVYCTSTFTESNTTIITRQNSSSETNYTIIFQQNTTIERNNTFIMYENSTMERNKTVIMYENSTMERNMTGGSNWTTESNITMISKSNTTVYSNETIIETNSTMRNETVIEGNSTSSNWTAESNNTLADGPPKSSSLALNESDIGTVIMKLFECYSKERTKDSCGKMHSTQGKAILTCSRGISSQITKDFGVFIRFLAEMKFRREMSLCKKTFCISRMTNCYGNMFRTSVYKEKTPTLLCSAVNGNLLAGCMQDIKDNCYQKDTVSFYTSFLAAACSGNDRDFSTLLDLTDCYPESSLDLLTENITEMCTDSLAKMSCSKSISTTGASNTTVTVAKQLELRYSSQCEPTVSCSDSISTCFDELMSTFTKVPQPLVSNLICSSMSSLKTCFKTSLCNESFYSNVTTFLEETCEPDACKIGVQMCYDTYKLNKTSPMSGTELMDEWCSYNTNITDCLKAFESTCKGVSNPSLELADKLKTMCEKREESKCYASSLACLQNNMRDASTPVTMWNSEGGDSTLCKNFNDTQPCLMEASKECTPGSEFEQITKDMNSILENQCAEECSDVRKTWCQANMQEYLIHAWTAPDKMQGYCGVNKSSENCYSQLVEKCSEGGSQQMIDTKVTVISSVVVAIASSCQSNITEPIDPPPPSCDVDKIAVTLNNFIVQSMKIEDIANSTVFCTSWKNTEVQITSMKAGCSGPVGDGIDVTIGKVSKVVNSVCVKTETCDIPMASTCVGNLKDSVQGIKTFKPFKNNKGQLRKTNCKKCSCQASSTELGPPQTCKKIPFQWTFICQAKNSTKQCIMEKTKTCDNAIQRQLDMSIDANTDEFNEDCKQHEKECDVIKAQTCTKQLIELTFTSPVMTDNDKKTVCSKVIQLQNCVDENIMSCSPNADQFYRKTVQSMVEVLNCPPPKPDEPSQPPPPPPPPPSTPRPCGVDETSLCVVKFTNTLSLVSLQSNTDTSFVCSSWKETVACISRVKSLYSLRPECKQACDHADMTVMQIEKSVDVMCSPPECFIEDAYKCLSDLKYQVISNGWQSGKSFPPEQSQGTLFCSLADKTTSCIDNATASCDNKMTMKCKDEYKKIQDMTGLQCKTPCETRPCLHGGLCTPVTSSGSNDAKYRCECPAQYSGVNCEIDMCKDQVFYACLHKSVDALIQNDFKTFCSLSSSSTKCIMSTQLKCPKSQIDIVMAAFEPVVTVLKCTEPTPPPPTGCELESYKCLKAKFASVSAKWDNTTGLIDDSVCKRYAEVSACVEMTPGCKSAEVSVDSVISVMCDEPVSKCDVRGVMEPVKNIEHGCWKAPKVKKPKKKDEPKRKFKKNLKKKCSKSRKPKCKHPKKVKGPRCGKKSLPIAEQKNNENHVDDGSDDVCWWIGKEMDKLNDTVNNCTSDKWSKIANKSVDDLKKKYMLDDLCNDPCDDHQCANGAECVAKGYGYSCTCRNGFTGEMCDEFKNETCDVKKANICLLSLRNTTTKITSGSTATEEDCKSLEENMNCVAVGLAACDGDISFSALDLVMTHVKGVQTLCKKDTPPVPICELKIANECVFKTTIELISEDSEQPYCDVIKSGHECITRVSRSCSETKSNFTAEMEDTYFASVSTVCPDEQCSLDTAMECLDKLDASNGAPDMCMTLSENHDCVMKSIMMCPDGVKMEVEMELWEAMNDSMRICIDPCEVNPCENNGTCSRSSTSENGYKCTCTEQFTGETCQSPKKCDFDAVDKCMKDADVVLSNVLTPACGNTVCGSISTLEVCVKEKIGECENRTEKVNKVVDIIKTLQTICTSSPKCEVQPPTCKVDLIQSCVTSFAKTTITSLTSPCGVNYADICMQRTNLTKTCTSSVQMTGCTREFTASVNSVVTKLNTVVGAQCDKPVLCEVKEAVQCVTGLKQKLNSLKKQKMCPHASKDIICKYIDNAQKCVIDNTQNCSSTESSDVMMQLMDVRKETSNICPLPCNAKPCTAGSVCQPVGFDDYTCKCPADQGDSGKPSDPKQPLQPMTMPSCNKEPRCEMKKASACIASFELFARSKKFMKKECECEKRSTEFCGYAKETLKCVDVAVGKCKNPQLKTPFYAQIFSIKAAVGITCFSPCATNPCMNSGVCLPVGRMPSRFPSMMAPSLNYTCKCLTGSTGPLCEQKTNNCSMSEIDQCMSNSVANFTSKLSDSSNPECTTPPSCSAKTARCGSAMSGVIEVVTVNMSRVCQQAPDCNLKDLSAMCMQGQLLSVPTFNDTTMEVGKDFCMMWKSVRGCMIGTQTGKCKAVVTYMDSQFQLFCVENPVPECPIRDSLHWVMDVSRDLLLANLTSSSTTNGTQSDNVPQRNNSSPSQPMPSPAPAPPPPPPPAPPKEEAPPPSREIQITGQCKMAVYIDGEERTELKDLSNVNTVKKVVITSKHRLLAVYAKNVMKCTGGGIIISMTNDKLLSGDMCKCLNMKVSKWMYASFDDSAWPKASVVDSYRCQKPKGISKKANWMWTSKKDDEIYCRCKIPSVDPPPFKPSNGSAPSPPVTPPDQPTPPPTPLPEPVQPEPDDACRHAQDTIKGAGDQLKNCSAELVTKINGTFQDLLTQYGANKTCMNPCTNHKCQNMAECVKDGISYNCTCQPGYRGRFCEDGGLCDLSQGSAAIKDLKKIIEFMMSNKNPKDEGSGEAEIKKPEAQRRRRQAGDDKQDSKQQDSKQQNSQDNTDEKSEEDTGENSNAGSEENNEPPSKPEEPWTWDTVCSVHSKKVYWILAQQLLPCSENTKMIFKFILPVIKHIKQVCETPSKPPMLKCDVMGQAKCALEQSETMFSGNSPRDLCEGLKKTYECVARVTMQCDTGTDNNDDDKSVKMMAAKESWMRYENQCQTECSTMKAMKCVSVDMSRTSSSDKMTTENVDCGSLADIDSCVTASITKCDDFVKAEIKKQVSVYLGPAMSKCVNPCMNNLCKAGSICVPKDSGYTCVCNNRTQDGTFCDQKQGCDFEKIKKCISNVTKDIVVGMLDPCMNSFQCSSLDSMQACVTMNSEKCEDTAVKDSIKAISDSLVSLKTKSLCMASSQATANCTKPPMDCQIDDLRACFSSSVSNIITSSCQDAGPNYMEICRSLNETKKCVDKHSVTCKGEQIEANIKKTTEFIESMTSQKCVKPICVPSLAQSSLAKLRALIDDEMNKKINNAPRLLMSADSKDMMCGMIYQSMSVVVSSVSGCSDSERDSTKTLVLAEYKRVEVMCPKPCMMKPCTDDAMCKQQGYARYECQCSETNTLPTCEKNPTCDINSAYLCVDKLQTKTVYNGEYTRTMNSFDLKDDFDFCREVEATQACVKTSLATCTDNNATESIFGIIIDMQKIVKRNCSIDICSSKPCRNNGKCTATGPRTFNCTCLPQFKGDRCEQELCPTMEINKCLKMPAMQILTADKDQLCATGDLEKCVKMNATTCDKTFQDVRLQLAKDLTITIADLCKPTPPPTCDLNKIKSDCPGEIGSLVEIVESMKSVAGMNDTTNSSTNMMKSEMIKPEMIMIMTQKFCQSWVMVRRCVSVKDNCNEVIKKVMTVFGMVCETPDNSTCSLKKSEECSTELSASLLQVEEIKPKKETKKKPARPKSLGKCKEKTLSCAKSKPDKPDKRTDICGEISMKKNCTLESVKTCDESIKEIVNVNTVTLTSRSLGDSDACKNLCDPNPCQNLGKCISDDSGFTCKCLEGFTGKTCQETPKCDIIGADACLDILRHSVEAFSSDFVNIYCSEISEKKKCLTTRLMGCAQKDKAFIEVTYDFLDSVEMTCLVAKEPTCEQKKLYSIYRNIAMSMYMTPGEDSIDRESLCMTLDMGYNTTVNMTSTCKDSTDLSAQASNKFSGAMDLFCPKPNCSLTTASQCLEEIYQITISDEATNTSCEKVFTRKRCVMEASSMCGQEKKSIVDEAFMDVMQISSNSSLNCTDLCSSMPCSNNGTCQQTSATEYTCNCTADYTGKQCEKPKGCDVESARQCLLDGNMMLVQGLLQPCKPSQSNCSMIDVLMACVTTNTKTCENGTVSGLKNVTMALSSMKQMCQDMSRLSQQTTTDITPQLRNGTNTTSSPSVMNTTTLLLMNTTSSAVSEGVTTTTSSESSTTPCPCSQLVPVSGQKCHKCDNAKSNEACNNNNQVVCGEGEVCMILTTNSSVTKGCVTPSSCVAGQPQNAGKCLYCCTGPDCSDEQPPDENPLQCGGNYSDDDLPVRKKRAAQQEYDTEEACELPPPDCDVAKLKECYASFTRLTFTELSVTCGMIDYAKICRQWNITVDCISSSSVSCKEDYRRTVDYSVEWLLQLTGSMCLRQDTCFSDLIPEGKKCVDSQMRQSSNKSSNSSSSQSVSSGSVCVSVDRILQAMESNVDQCADSSKAPVLSDTDKIRNSLSSNCSFPCTAQPCQNNGTCTQTSDTDYNCTCTEGFTGKNCSQVEMYAHDSDTMLTCRQDRTVESYDVQLMMPLNIFCQSKTSLSININGYISFSSSNTTIDYSKFCSNGAEMLAPLFTKQDCSCEGSSVSYRIYYKGETGGVKDKVFNRAQRELMRVRKNMKQCSLSSVIVVTYENMLPVPCSAYKKSYPEQKGNSYQVVIMSCDSSVYAQFVYQSVDTQHYGTNVYMGYAGLNGQCLGNIRSGTSSMNGLENAYLSDNGSRGTWVQSLSDSCEMKQPDAVDTCLLWVNNSPDLVRETLDSCPCSSKQASVDPRYHIEISTIDFFRHCYSVNRLQTVYSNGSNIHVKQMCCYDQLNKGVLFTSAPYAGMPMVTNAPSIAGMPNDTDGYKACCVDSIKYCGLCRAKRPSATCNAYSSCTQGLLFGDPHIFSADGFSTIFNGHGEYDMVKMTDNSFRLQARTAPMITKSGIRVNATSYVAFVAQEAGYSKVQVELNDKRDGIIIYIDGVQKTTTDKAQIYKSDVYISASNTGLNATFPGGWTMGVGVSVQMLTFTQSMPSKAWGKTRGLLGVYNGDPSDDLTAPDGTIIPTTSSLKDIHYLFGMKWQVTASASLFTYPAGKTTSSYSDVNFEPAFEPPCYTDNEKQTGRNLCGDNEECYYDYCVTKDPSIAIGTKAAVDDFNEKRLILMSLGPQLTIRDMDADSNGVYSIQATVGAELTLELVALSSQDVKINIEMFGNVSQESKVSLASMTATSRSVTYRFKWTPTSLKPVDVSFIAVDANGAMSGKLQAIVTICNLCSNHGSCNFLSSTPINSGTAYRLASCSCLTGWTGIDCSEDYNGCQAMACSSPAACTDLSPAQQAATGLSYSCSSCPAGYHSEQCIDIDECKDGLANEGCQNCRNTRGSYTCTCQPGFRLASSGIECLDIDECAEGTSTCKQKCINTRGSYTCMCNPGFVGANCDPETVCGGSHKCSHFCAVINGQEKCSCMSGFSLDSDGYSCLDVNECSNTDLNRCSVKNMCTNTLGGYTCACPHGSHVGQDLRTCEPCSDTTWGPSCMNQCKCGPTVRTCDKVQGCTLCQSGWQGVNCTTDIDECAIGTAKCQPGARCVNAVGNYYCICSNGGGSDCYVSTTAQPAPGIMCETQDLCSDRGTCYLSNDDKPYCVCHSGFSGERCDFVAQQISTSSSTNTALIAGLSALGAVLLLVACGILFYCFIYPRMRTAKKFENASSDISGEDQHLAKFDQNSVRINKWWPKSPARYTPQTYATQDEPTL